MKIEEIFSVKDKVALVTGGAGGIGQSICRHLSAEGAIVAIHYHTSESEAEKLATGLNLIDKSGCVIGVNTYKFKDSEGLNFAISSQTAQRFIDKYFLSNQKNKSQKI